MSDTNPNNNDRKLQAKRDSGSDSKTNQVVSTTRLKKPSLGLLEATRMAPHDDPDDAMMGHRYVPTIVPLPPARASNTAGYDDDPETEFDADAFLNCNVRNPATKQRRQLAPAEPRPPQVRSAAGRSNEAAEASVAATASVAAESQVLPGAVHVPGARHPPRHHVDDDFTLTGQDNTPQDPLVTAHLVGDDEEDQDEVRVLRRELKELRKFREMVDRAVVANVVASEVETENPRDIELDNDEAIDMGIQDEVHDVETGEEAERAADVENEQDDTAEAKGPTKTRRNLLIVAGLLVVLAIIAGIAVPLVLKEHWWKSSGSQPTPELTPITP